MKHFEKLRKVLHEYKSGDLKTVHGKKVKSPDQAMAIALSEQKIADKKRKIQRA